MLSRCKAPPLRVAHLAPRWPSLGGRAPVAGGEMIRDSPGARACAAAPDVSRRPRSARPAGPSREFRADKASRLLSTRASKSRAGSQPGGSEKRLARDRRATEQRPFPAARAAASAHSNALSRTEIT